LAAHNRWYVYLATLAVPIAVVSLFKLLPIPSLTSYSIPSGAMQPTLQVGDLFEAATHAFAGRPPARGDVVVFKNIDGKSDYVKRIVGLPGDRVQMRGGILYLNDAPVPRERVGDYQLPTDGSKLALYRETLPGGRSYEIVEISDDDPLDNSGPVLVPPATSSFSAITATVQATAAVSGRSRSTAWKTGRSSSGGRATARASG
jgi:signal peptidase I